MSKSRSVDSYARFSGYNTNEKQYNTTNYSSNYNDLPSQVPDPNNRFANPPPQLLGEDGSQQLRHRVKNIESDKLFQLLNDPQYQFNQLGPTKVFVKVFTNWCGPCKTIAPKIEELSNNPRYSDILFVQVDGEKITENLKKHINVSAVPIFFAFVGGKQFGDYVVGPDLKQIVSKLDEMSELSVQSPSQSPYPSQPQYSRPSQPTPSANPYMSIPPHINHK